MIGQRPHGIGNGGQIGAVFSAGVPSTLVI
jgi:hypothetical protein